MRGGVINVQATVGIEHDMELGFDYHSSALIKKSVLCSLNIIVQDFKLI